MDDRGGSLGASRATTRPRSPAEKTQGLRARAKITRRNTEPAPPIPESATPWQEIYRSTLGQLDSGAAMELAVKYRGVAQKTPRHNH